jgi:hypothetical protein
VSPVFAPRFIAVCAIAYAACVVLAGLTGDAGDGRHTTLALLARWGIAVVYIAGAAHLARTRAEWLSALIANGPAALGAGLAVGVIASIALGGASAHPLRTLGGLAIPIVAAGNLAPAVGALVSGRARRRGDFPTNQ